MKWKCLRCDLIFDDKKVKECNCKTSPSPWEPEIPWWERLLYKLMGL